jgi:hypothetical protein
MGRRNIVLLHMCVCKYDEPELVSKECIYDHMMTILCRISALICNGYTRYSPVQSHTV